MTLQPLSLNLNKNEDSLEFLEDEVFDRNFANDNFLEFKEWII